VSIVGRDDLLAMLAGADMLVEGRMPWSSNGTFLVTLGDDEAKAVYKPRQGERPLWDFPAGLFRREAAAWELSDALGWDVIPPTIVRDGPFGVGSVQLFVPADFEQHYFTIHERRPDLHDQLRAICAFDLVANNTDRKGGHCLLGLDDRVWGIDNGLCFAEEFKLRTVIWEFAGEPLDDELVEPLAELATDVPPGVATLLDDDEVRALRRRAGALVRNPVFPHDRTGHRYPWPLV
jgi:hypothetical protein